VSRGNAFAYIVLLGWPLFSIWLYKKKNIQLATLITIIGGFMLLAVGTTVDFPLIPPLGKHSMPVVSAVIGCWFIKKQTIKYFSNEGITQVLVLLLLVGTFVTIELNGDQIFTGEKILPGLTRHDAISSVIRAFIQITPFFIGKQFFKTYQDQRLMFRFLAVVGLIYSIPILFEVRMSPQLHTWIYGYFPHSFAQASRDGGFRPVVFIGHGLAVAFFIVCTIYASVSLSLLGEKIRNFTASRVSYYLVFILVLCKSKASLLYGVFGFIMIKKISYENQIRAATLLAIITLAYPAMSVLKVFPHQQVLDVAASLAGERRTESLAFRFRNERILLEHAVERPYFGWGGAGRNRVYNEDTGKDESVTDGSWIIIFGMYGLFGYIAKFGLLVVSIFSARRAAKLIIDKDETSLLAAHALLVGIIMIDQIPNSSLAPWLWLVVGALLGRSENIIALKKVKSRV